MSFFLKNLKESVLKFTNRSVTNLKEPIQEPIKEELLQKLLKEESIQEEPIQEESIKEEPLQEEPLKPYEEKLNKTNIKVINEPYKEIEHLSNDELTKEFTFDRNIEDKHIIHLCLYRINRVLPIPFLEIYLEKENTEYGFPKKVLNNDIFKDIIEEITGLVKIKPIKELDDNDEEEKDAEDLFLEECIDFFHENITTKEDIEPIYKGFIELENDKENLFVVFDCTNIEIAFKEIKQRWVIVEEILEDKSLFDPLLESHISELIVRLFKENKVLANIRKNKKYLPRPKYLYLCKKENDKYENVYYDNNDNEYERITLIPERVQHPVFKEIYLFSTNPMEINLSFLKIKKFIIFTNPENMIEKDLNKVLLEEGPITEEEIIVGEQSTTEGEQSTTEREQSTTEREQSTTEREQPITEGEQSTNQEETIELKIPNDPVIGFKEYGIEFWCTKSTLYFTQ